MVSGFLQPRFGRAQIPWNSAATVIEPSQQPVGEAIVLAGGFPVPVSSLLRVLRNNVSSIVKVAENNLRRRVAEFGRAAKIVHCIQVVTRDADA